MTRNITATNAPVPFLDSHGYAVGISNKQMPIFEFQCKKCNKKFEQLVSNKSERPACPGCKNKKTEKLFSAFSAKSSSGKITRGHTCSSCSGGTCSHCH